MPAGETPCTIALYVRDDLVDSVQPGDRVQITGIYRAIPLRVNPRTRNFKSVYKTHVEALHFKKADTKRLYEFEGDEDEGSSSTLKNLTAERVAKLKQLASEPDIYDKLARAIAPDIFENDDIKKGILLQLFGGTSQYSNDKSSSQQTQSSGGKQQHRSRSEINILLCGDPGESLHRWTYKRLYGCNSHWITFI